MKNDVAAVQRRWWERLRNTRRERIEFVQASADFFLRLGVDLPRIEHPNDRCQFAENVGDKPNSQAKELFFGRGARHNPTSVEPEARYPQYSATPRTGA